MNIKSFTEYLNEEQEYKSAGTSLNQVSAGIKHAAKHIIKPNSLNVDIGGGKYDAGKHHVESSVEGAKMHVYDPYNRSDEHNAKVKNETKGKADYAGCHNVLNVIKDEKDRHEVIKNVKESLHSKGVAHFTVYEGDKTGNARATQKDQSWQNHKPTKEYEPEIKKVFDATHHVARKGSNIICTPKE